MSIKKDYDWFTVTKGYRLADINKSTAVMCIHKASGFCLNLDKRTLKRTNKRILVILRLCHVCGVGWWVSRAQEPMPLGRVR